MSEAAPRFALFVSSIEGRLASRPGNPHAFIGARVPGQEGGEILWQPDVVVAITESDYLRHSREWDALLRNGDLKPRTAEDFAAYGKALAAEEEARDRELARLEQQDRSERKEPSASSEGEK